VTNKEVRVERGMREGRGRWQTRGVWSHVKVSPGACIHPHLQTSSLKKIYTFQKKIPGGMGGSPYPPTGRLGDFEKRLYIYYRNKALFVNWSLQNTTARPAKVRIWMSIVHRFKLV